METWYLVTKFATKIESIEDVAVEKSTEKCVYVQYKIGKPIKRLIESTYETYYKSKDEAISVVNARIKRLKQQAAKEKLERAAPQLLEALQYILKCGRGSSGRIILETEDEEKIIAAIKAATEV